MLSALTVTGATNSRQLFSQMSRLLLCSLTIVAAAAGCQFGPAPGCVYPCHCMDGAVCDSTTGDCPAGCDDGDPNGYMWRGAWSGPGCQVGNVAYGQSATGADWNGYSTPPARAVDGDRDPNYRATNGVCAYVRANHWSELYWQVDLGHSYVIYNITVYSTDGTHPYNHNYLTSRVVEVGDESSQYTPCGSLGDDNNVQQVDVVCPQPLVGRYVRIRATRHDFTTTTPRLYLCEVFVIGYQFEDCSVSGSFGPGCMADCHCRGDCDVISGKCSTQCEDGWVGDDCQQACDAGSWGSMCNNTCRCRDQNEACHHVNGNCAQTGCAERYRGIGCDAELPVLPSPPTIVKVNETHLELEFPSWEASPGSGDRPSSYVVEIRREGAEDWEELKMLSELESGMISVTIEHNFQVTANYEVRVLPILTHEGTDYQGHGVPAAFTVTAPTAQATTPAPVAAAPVPNGGGDSSSTVIASVALVLVLVIAAVVLLFFLRRRGTLASIYDRVVKRRSAEPRSPSAGFENPGFTNQALSSERDYETITARSTEQLPDSATVAMVREDKADIDGDSVTLPAEWVSDEELNIYGNQGPLGLPIKVPDLAAHIRDMKGRADAFQYEYMQIPFGQTAKWAIGAETVNKGKNRFNNIMAYDHSRVTLEMALHDQGQGYINANFIPGYKDVERAYIASQGPRIHTIVDMWRMIWQYKVNRVVMVTKIMEEGKAKCEYYWPEFEESHEQEYGKFAVKLLSTENYADYTIRTMSVIHQGESRPVTHFHFVGWPDHGVPLLATSLLEFRRKVRAHDDHASGPLLVHCSAGVGRTGTFIALDYLLDQAEAEGEVDVFKYTALMRNYRVNMIQNLGQYTFVYDALLQGLLSKDTRVPCGQMAEVFPTLQLADPVTGLSLLQKQFQELEDLKPPMSDENSQGLLPENEHKNRSRHIIPSEKSRPFLLPRVGGRTNYINAAFVDGYRHQKSFIVTQMPFHQTLGDFWQMLYDHKSPSIVLLHDFDHSDPEDEMCPRYWPDAVGDVMEFDTLLVEMEAEETIEDDIISRQFRITQSKEEGKSLVVSQLHLRGWPSDADTPEEPDRLISLLEVLERWQQRSGDRTITVQCKTGAHQSGVLCAASYVLEKLKVDQEVDVFLAVAQTRLGRPQLIHSLEQYVFLHEIAIKYMDRNDTYANFK